MSSLNRAILLGLLMRDPTLRQTPRGAPFCIFDLQLEATERGEPCIIRVIIFGKQAEPAARRRPAETGSGIP